jgi:hypothetical protein
MVLKPTTIHPAGEENTMPNRPTSDQVEVDTFDGKLFIDWDPDASVTPLGQLPFFIQFLKMGHRFEPWVEDCPLVYRSPNAPLKVDVLGSLFLSVLSGHRRYAHMTALLSDGVNSKLLGMQKVVSDDSARRALKKIDEERGVNWLQDHLQSCYEPLLAAPWILDSDVTVKPLYGHQEGAVVGYNPHKPGRPSHTYHTYIMANLRMVLDVEVQAGNQSGSAYSAPGLLSLLDRLPQACWPEFVRGDCDWGSDSIMADLEAIGMPYLFKLKKSKNVKSLIYKHHCLGKWTAFKEGWEAKEDVLQLQGWSGGRRVVIVRRRIAEDREVLLEHQNSGQKSLALVEEPENIKIYEYSVLVTSVQQDMIAIVQHYRDRADCENVFDEIKNQWGWGGYTTRDLKSCRFMSRMIALIYNWWSLFVRMANPSGHLEAITSKPLLLTGVGRLTETGRQKKMTVTSHHGKAEEIREIFQHLGQFFSDLKVAAPQLTPIEKWCRILEKVVEKILPVGSVGPPKLLAGSA